MKKSRLAIVLTSFLLLAWQSACSREDKDQARRKLHEAGQELKHETKEAGRELRKDAHEASREVKKDADKRKRDANSK